MVAYKGGRIVAFKKDRVVLEEGIYMPDGTNIEPQVSSRSILLA